MKASKFSDSQKAFIIKQGEECTPVAEICQKAGISQATYFCWKKKYAGLLPTEIKRLKQKILVIDRRLFSSSTRARGAGDLPTGQSEGKT